MVDELLPSLFPGLEFLLIGCHTTWKAPLLCVSSCVSTRQWGKNLPAMRETACNTGDAGSIPGQRKSSGEGNGNALRYSGLKNLWTEEPGGLQSMGVTRVRHNLATEPPPPYSFQGSPEKKSQEEPSLFLFLALYTVGFESIPVHLIRSMSIHPSIYLFTLMNV